MFFIKQFLKSPLTIGSVCPSGRTLSRVLARLALDRPSQCPGLIVDLGAGTGVVTRELLAMGITPDAILALDISEEFRNVFNKLCPAIRLHVADAKSLYSIITRSYPGTAVLAIISSLPLRIMNKDEIARIMHGIRRILLERGGCLLQYTYALWHSEALSQYGFSLAFRHYVVRNIPPAVVEKYYIQESSRSPANI